MVLPLARADTLKEMKADILGVSPDKVVFSNFRDRKNWNNFNLNHKHYPDTVINFELLTIISMSFKIGIDFGGVLSEHDGGEKTDQPVEHRSSAINVPFCMEVLPKLKKNKK